MKTALWLLLLASNSLWLVAYHGQTKAQDARVEYEHLQAQRYLATANKLYYENEANDRAATECAQKTGFRYNCANGSQRISCE